MPKTRNCRRTNAEQERHSRAVRIRKMTDDQLCDYIDEIQSACAGDQPSPAEVIEQFLKELAVRSDTSVRISDATIRKLRQAAVDKGYGIRVNHDI